MRTAIIYAVTSTATWADHARTGLHRAGLRAGGARRAVVDHLAAQDCCLSAQEIRDGIAAEGGRVGIASVYRALDLLAELRLVHRVDVGDGVARYEPARADGEHHHHLVCDRCGQVQSFSDDALERALERVAASLGVPSATHEVVLHGPCRACGDLPAPAAQTPG